MGLRPELLLSETPETQASLNVLKAPPQSATFAHLTQLQTKFNQLMTFGEAKRLLQGLPSSHRYPQSLLDAARQPLWLL